MALLSRAAPNVRKSVRRFSECLGSEQTSAEKPALRCADNVCHAHPSHPNLQLTDVAIQVLRGRSAEWLDELVVAGVERVHVLDVITVRRDTPLPTTKYSRPRAAAVACNTGPAPMDSSRTPPSRLCGSVPFKSRHGDIMGSCDTAHHLEALRVKSSHRGLGGCGTFRGSAKCRTHSREPRLTLVSLICLDDPGEGRPVPSPMIDKTPPAPACIC